MDISNWRIDMETNNNYWPTNFVDILLIFDIIISMRG